MALGDRTSNNRTPCGTLRYPGAGHFADYSGAQIVIKPLFKFAFGHPPLLRSAIQGSGEGHRGSGCCWSSRRSNLFNVTRVAPQEPASGEAVLKDSTRGLFLRKE
jgi:hypothetical protein